MREGFFICDADAHIMEPMDLWEEAIEPPFRDRAPRLGVSSAGRQTMMVEGEALTAEHGKYPAASPEFIDAWERAGQRFARAKSAGYSAESRLEDMDTEGVDTQILYPTLGGKLVGRLFRDTELLVACCRAYNDWTAQYCAASPRRLRWAALLPLQDVSASIEEAGRAFTMGAVGACIRPNPISGRCLHHEDYFPLWAKLSSLGLPLCIHDSGSPRLPSLGDRMDSHTTAHIAAHPFEAMLAMAAFVWYGVFERFPGLKVVHVEADGGWVPYWLQRMEQHWKFSGNAEHSVMKRSPYEYFKNNVFVTCRSDEITLKSALELVGDSNFLWSTDYPHSDGTWPMAIKQMLDEAPVGKASKRKILWDNSQKTFRLAVPDNAVIA